MTQRSLYNNTGVPLKPFGIFTGLWEPTGNFLEISSYLTSSAYLSVSIQQSIDASAVVINTTFNYAPTDSVTVYNTSVGLPYYRVILNNQGDVQVAHMNLNTLLVAVPATTSVAISGAVDTVITGPLDSSGNVKVDATNLITETLATRRVDFLVVDNWYRVASVGLTTGAEWNAIGAIVDGESVPVIGRLFKCLAIGPAVAGGGECYDVEYTDAVSATITNFPATQPVSGIVGIDAGANGVSFNDTSTVTVTSLTNPLPTGTNVIGLVGLDTTGGANTVNISQTGSQNGVQVVNTNASPVQCEIYTPLPTGSNTIGVVGIDTSLNTVKIDSVNNVISGTVSLTDPTTVRVRDTNGDPIVTTAGNLMVGINNIYTANPLHTIVDSGTFWQTTQPVSVAGDVSCNIVSALPAGTNGIGSVTIFNSSIINTYTYADISGAWVGSGVDLRAYSLADLYMLSAGSVTSTLGMTFIGQYSPDNIHWFDSGNTLQLTTANPQGIATGILTASPYIRLKADPANAPGDVATDVTLWIPAKAI